MVNTSTGRPRAAHGHMICTKGSVSEGGAGIKDFIVGLMMTLPMHSYPLVVNAALLPARGTAVLSTQYSHSQIIKLQVSPESTH